MKNTIYAAIAACLAMLATSGIVALATAAPPTEEAALLEAEAELTAHLDRVIETRLATAKASVLRGLEDTQ